MSILYQSNLNRMSTLRKIREKSRSAVLRTIPPAPARRTAPPRQRPGQPGVLFAHGSGQRAAAPVPVRWAGLRPADLSVPGSASPLLPAASPLPRRVTFAPSSISASASGGETAHRRFSAARPGNPPPKSSGCLVQQIICFWLSEKQLYAGIREEFILHLLTESLLIAGVNLAKLSQHKSAGPLPGTDER